eukprot:Mycagemm_TRINITY_DN10297_c0_g2::TRINITY_DN10297_c0_g2_i1::g.3817::m.3817 type:complete len:142 gc:universal TRINITY_DN10297_c0_g2_i1:509-84(-)
MKDTAVHFAIFIDACMSKRILEGHRGGQWQITQRRCGCSRSCADCSDAVKTSCSILKKVFEQCHAASAGFDLHPFARPLAPSHRHLGGVRLDDRHVEGAPATHLQGESLALRGDVSRAHGLVMIEAVFQRNEDRLRCDAQA